MLKAIFNLYSFGRMRCSNPKAPPRYFQVTLRPRDPRGKEPVGLGNRRLQIDRSGPFLASPLFENTVFLPHSRVMGLQIRQKLVSLGSILAFDAPSPTDS